MADLAFPKPTKREKTPARLERRTPLRAYRDALSAPGTAVPLRSKPMKRKRARRIDRETPEEQTFKADVHRLPCAGIRCFPGHVCRDRLGRRTRQVEQSHERSIARGAGTAVKQRNHDSWPFCGELAGHWDNLTGPFKTFKKADRLKFQRERVLEAQAALRGRAA